VGTTAGGGVDPLGTGTGTVVAPRVDWIGGVGHGLVLPGMPCVDRITGVGFETGGRAGIGVDFVTGICVDFVPEILIGGVSGRSEGAKLVESAGRTPESETRSRASGGTGMIESAPLPRIPRLSGAGAVSTIGVPVVSVVLADMVSGVTLIGVGSAKGANGGGEKG
jgi:hypothetical protein